jgi:nitroreductase
VLVATKRDLGPWRALVDLARWAPSPHNIQPWRLLIRSARESELLVGGDRLLPDTDPSGRFTEVAMGVFVESLAIAAAARGLALRPAYTHEPLRPGPRPIPFATLELRDAEEEEPLAAELIQRRRTSRLPYDGRPAFDSAMQMAAAAAAAAGHVLSWSHDSELVAWTVELNRDTLFYDLADPAARAEVGRWLRFSAAKAERARDGFSPAALGFPGWLLRAFFHLHALLQAPGIRQLVRRLYTRTMGGTRTIAWLAGPFETSPDWIAAGRMLTRVWLTLEREGLSLHPFGSIVTNEKANARLQARLGRDESQGTLWLIMRVGHSPVPPRSLRLETDELLLA